SAGSVGQTAERKLPSKEGHVHQVRSIWYVWGRPLLMDRLRSLRHAVFLWNSARWSSRFETLGAGLERHSDLGLGRCQRPLRKQLRRAIHVRFLQRKSAAAFDRLHVWWFSL